MADGTTFSVVFNGTGELSAVCRERDCGGGNERVDWRAVLWLWR